MVKTIRIHAHAPLKPALGTPCNGCGACCALETCPVGRVVFRQRGGPCPALEWVERNARYRCGLMVSPKRYLRLLPDRWEQVAQRMFARWISAGTGCDADVDLVPGKDAES